MPRALFAVKDAGGLNVLREPARILAGWGWKVDWVAEGVAMERLLSAGETVFGGAPKPEAFNPETFIRTDLQPKEVLSALRPDVLVSAMGKPNGLEGSLCREAASRNLPTVIVSDIPGSGLRGGFMPDSDMRKVKILTMFPEDTEITDSYFTGSFRPKVIETGSPAFDGFADRKVGLPSSLHRVNCILEPTFLVLGQNDCTKDFLKGALQAAEAIEGSLVVFAPHPNFLQPGLCQEWLGLIREAKSPVIIANKSATVREIMLAADFVVSGFSTGLLEAASLPGFAGPIAVSWVSESVRRRMAEALGGLTTFPSVSCGGAIEVYSPEEFAAKVPLPNSDGFRTFRRAARQALKERLHIDGAAAARVAVAIQSIV